MDVATWVEGVRWSARLAASAFVVAVLVPPLRRAPERPSQWLWLVCCSGPSYAAFAVLPRSSRGLYRLTRISTSRST